MKKIGISGIPCTGKSTLAIALINECHKLNKFKSIIIIFKFYYLLYTFIVKEFENG
jgi:uridine kinase